jgi:hypothetical protein
VADAAASTANPSPPGGRANPVSLIAIAVVVTGKSVEISQAPAVEMATVLHAVARATEVRAADMRPTGDMTDVVAHAETCTSTGLRAGKTAGAEPAAKMAAQAAAEAANANSAEMAAADSGSDMAATSHMTPAAAAATSSVSR